MKQADLATNFRAAVLQSEIPFINGHTVAKFMLSHAVRESGYKVVLTGEGSDEILAGYPPFRRDMLLPSYGRAGPAEGRKRLLPQRSSKQSGLSRTAACRKAIPTWVSCARVLLGCVPSWLEAMGGTVVPHASADARRLSSSRIVVPTSLVSLLASLDIERRLKGRNAVHAALYLWGKTILPHYILINLGDRMEMAHSIEGRVRSWTITSPSTSTRCRYP